MTESAEGKAGYVAAAFALGICMIVAAGVFGYFHYSSRTHSRTITVVGSATKRFESDVVKWRMGISRRVGLQDLKKGYELVKRDKAELFDFLQTNGVDTEKIVLNPMRAQHVYDREGTPTGYTVSQGMFLTSNNIEKIEPIALDPTALFDRGVILNYSHLEFFNSKIAVLKKELLDQATKDARERAESIAKSSGLEIGAMLSARQGVFQITEPYSTEVSDYGVYSTATKEKQIRITVRATFEVK